MMSNDLDDDQDETFLDQDADLPSHEALRLALDLLDMKPSDLLATLRASASPGESPVARSTVNRWLAGTSPVPAAVKLWLRDRLVLTCRDGIPIELPKPLVIGITGDGGTGKTPVAIKLAHLARSCGLKAVYVDAVDGCFNTGSLKAVAAAGRGTLVIKSRDRLRDIIARVNAAAPHLIFVDTPVRSFADRDGSNDYGNDQVFEADLLEAADHFLVMTRADTFGVEGAISLSEPLEEAGADWRLVLQGVLPIPEHIADAIAKAKTAGVKVAPLFVQPPPSYGTRTLEQVLRTSDYEILDIPDMFALWHILDEVLQEHDVRLEDSEVPPGVDLKAKFENVVAALTGC